MHRILWEGWITVPWHYVMHAVGAELTSCTATLSGRMFEVTQTWKWLTRLISPRKMLVGRSFFFFFSMKLLNMKGVWLIELLHYSFVVFWCLARLSGTSTDARCEKKKTRKKREKKRTAWRGSILNGRQYWKIPESLQSWWISSQFGALAALMICWRCV